MSDESQKPSDAEPSAPHNDTSNPNQKTIDTAAEKIISALTRINRANRKADAAEHKRTDSREKRRFVIEKIEIALIAVYAFVTIFEWRTFDSERQTMENKLQANQRAWVCEVGENATPSGDDVVLTISFKNTGKTPALHCNIDMFCSASIASIPRMDTPQNPSLFSKTIAPDQEVQSVRMNVPIKTIKRSDQENSRFYFWGTAFYDDIFGKHHWTQFCYSADTKDFSIVEFRATANHNDCDNN